jgi:hypothetical protein
LHDIWLRFSEKVIPKEVHHHDVVRFALKELEREMAQWGEEEVLQRFREQVSESTSGKMGT